MAYLDLYLLPRCAFFSIPTQPNYFSPSAVKSIPADKGLAYGPANEWLNPQSKGSCGILSQCSAEILKDFSYIHFLERWSHLPPASYWHSRLFVCSGSQYQPTWCYQPHSWCWAWWWYSESFPHIPDNKHLLWCQQTLDNFLPRRWGALWLSYMLLQILVLWTSWTSYCPQLVGGPSV